MPYPDKPLFYPPSRQDQVDEYNGVQIPDPTDGSKTRTRTETKLEAQNQVTFSYLNEIPIREQIKQRLTKLWDFEKFGIPFKEGIATFYFKTTVSKIKVYCIP